MKVNHATKSASNGQAVWIFGSGLDQAKYARLVFEKDKSELECIASRKAYDETGGKIPAEVNREPAVIAYRDSQAVCVIWRCYSGSSQRFQGWIELESDAKEIVAVEVNRAEVWQRFAAYSRNAGGVFAVTVGRNLRSNLIGSAFISSAGVGETIKQGMAAYNWAAQKDGFAIISERTESGHIIVGRSLLGVVPVGVAGDPVGATLIHGQDLFGRSPIKGIPAGPVIVWESRLDLGPDWAGDSQVGRALQSASVVIGSEIIGGNRGITSNWQDKVGRWAVLGNRFIGLGGNPGASESICLEYVNNQPRSFGDSIGARGPVSIGIDGPAFGLAGELAGELPDGSRFVSGKISGNCAIAGNVFRDCTTGVHCFGACYDLEICGNIFDGVNLPVMLTGAHRPAFNEFWPIYFARVSDNDFRGGQRSIRIAAMVASPRAEDWPVISGIVLDRNRAFGGSPAVRGYSAAFVRNAGVKPEDAKVELQSRAIRYQAETNLAGITSPENYAYLADPFGTSKYAIHDNFADVLTYVKS